MTWAGQTEAQPSRKGAGMALWLQEEVTIEIQGLNSICDGPNYFLESRTLHPNKDK